MDQTWLRPSSGYRQVSTVQEVDSGHPSHLSGPPAGQHECLMDQTWPQPLSSCRLVSTVRGGGQWTPFSSVGFISCQHYCLMDQTWRRPPSGCRLVSIVQGVDTLLNRQVHQLANMTVSRIKHGAVNPLDCLMDQTWPRPSYGSRQVSTVRVWTPFSTVGFISSPT
jgi:hypothetical protein